MSELIDNLREEFHDSETRHIYAEDFLNSYIATQIKVLREQAGWTQAELAERAGMKQERISVLEDVNYSSWTANVLKRLAKAFDMRLSVKIESFGSFLQEFGGFGRESLMRPSFQDDPAFKPQVESQVTASTPVRALRLLRGTETPIVQPMLPFERPLLRVVVSALPGTSTDRPALDANIQATPSFKQKGAVALGG